MTNQHPHGTSYSGEPSKQYLIINMGVLNIGDVTNQTYNVIINIQDIKNVVNSFWEEVKDLDIPEKQDLERTVKEIDDSDDKAYIQTRLERLKDYLSRNASTIGNLALIWGGKLIELLNKLKNG